MTQYHVGGFVGKSWPAVPTVGLLISIPDVLIKSHVGKRLYNTIGRIAMKFALHMHHIRIMPAHFKQTNRAKYHHKERTKVWKAIKRKNYGSITDLVATGTSRNIMLSLEPKVAFKGTAEAVLVGFMRYKWPFPVSSDTSNPARVTIEQMNKELTAWTHADMMFGVENYREKWVAEWNRRVATRPRFKKAIAPILAGI